MRAAAWVAAALALAACSGESPPRPNVLLVTLDGLRRDHLSAFGYARQTSPNIDRLAAGGLRFENLVTSSCSTKGALTSLLTALPVTSHRLAQHEEVLPADIATLAEAFQDAGYATAGFVATHWLASELGYARGFERFDDLGGRRKHGAKGVAERVLDFLGTRVADPRPMFVYIHFKEPHPPWNGGAPFSAPRKERVRPFGKGCAFIPKTEAFDGLGSAEREDLIALYDSEIHAADAQLGRILDQLEASGELARTVVAVSTDHGIELGERYSFTHGRNPHDEVVRTFLVLYDGRGPLPARDTARIQGRIQDVGTTLLALADVPRPEAFEGLDLLNEARRLPELALVRCTESFAVRSLDWKLVGFDFGKKHLRGHAPQTGTYLYDLRADPGERVNVRSEQPKVHTRLRRASGALAAVGDWADDDVIPTALPPDKAKQLRALGYGE